jgi:hypothetical protein
MVMSLTAALLIARASAALALGCAAQTDGSVLCELPIVEDSIVAAAHRENNHGHETHTWVKVGNGVNRAFERIDLSALAGRTDITSAVLRHYVIKVGDGAGALFAVLPFDPSWPTPFVEGKDRFQTIGYCSKPEWKRTGFQSGLPGVTYNCPVDPLPNDSDSSDCPVQWAAGVPGFLNVFLDTTPRPPTPPTCGQSLDCYQAGGAPGSCWNTFEFDLTAYVQGEVAAGRLSTDVMIRRATESGPGGVWWFSTQGAVCVLGSTDPPLQALRPALVVRLASGPVPSFTPPPDPCS